MTDRELVEAFVERNDQEAFAALVRRHAGMVYAAARRMLGTHAVHAEDVTQAVFLLLAQRAGRLLRRQDVAGWLHEATRYCCMDVLKRERRRRRHEQEVAMRRGEEAAATGDAEMLVVLDEALGKLGSRYRGGAGQQVP